MATATEITVSGADATNALTTQLREYPLDDAIPVMDARRFDLMARVAQQIAMAGLIPDHLRGRGDRADEQTIGNCFLVVNQAVRWGMDPCSVMPETYAVGGKLAYQGKLVAALINTRANIKEGRLQHSYAGAGDDRTITISATFCDETEPRTITLSVRQAKTGNTIWTRDPDQKLFYSGAIKWARRHCPELMLGVLTDDDLERIAESREVEQAVKVEARQRGAAAQLAAVASNGTAAAGGAGASSTAGVDAAAPVSPPASDADIQRKRRGRPRKADLAAAAIAASPTANQPTAETMTPVGLMPQRTPAEMEREAQEFAAAQLSDAAAKPSPLSVYDPSAAITLRQESEIGGLIEALSVPPEAVEAMLARRGVTAIKQLTHFQADEILRNLQGKLRQQQGQQPPPAASPKN